MVCIRSNFLFELGLLFILQIPAFMKCYNNLSQTTINMQLVFLFIVVYVIVVGGQNIFFDCRQEIIGDVIKNNPQKKTVFLDSGQNSIALGLPINTTITEQTQVPTLNSNSFWRLNESVDTITIDFSGFGSYYAITGIAIKNVNSTDCQFEDIITPSYYTLRYNVSGSSYEANWSEGTEVIPSSPQLKSNINPITVQELFITRSLAAGEEYCVQYEIYGCPIGTNSGTLNTVPILEYKLSSEPLSDTNSGYTGLCCDGRCFGGVGTLNDGIIGEISSLDLTKDSNFTVWQNISSLIVSFKLSHYFYITALRIHSVLLPANAFNQYKTLTNQQIYSISILTTEINNTVQSVNVSIQSNSTGYLAITEIEIISQNNRNIQGSYRMPYQPLTCGEMTSHTSTAQPTTESSTERRELEYFILIIAVCVLGIILLFMVLVLVLLASGVVVLSRGRHISEKQLENLIKPKPDENTYITAHNTIASYADLNETGIRNFREKIPSQLPSEEYIEMDKLVENRKHSTEKLFSNETNDKVFSHLFQNADTDDKGYTLMQGASKDKFPDDSNQYDEICKSTD